MSASQVNNRIRRRESGILLLATIDKLYHFLTKDNEEVVRFVHQTSLMKLACTGVVRRRVGQQRFAVSHDCRSIICCTKYSCFHSFRRPFAINMLRAGVDVLSLQKLMGHADLQVLSRYLEQTTEDIEQAHRIGSPVDKGGL